MLVHNKVSGKLTALFFTKKILPTETNKIVHIYFRIDKCSKLVFYANPKNNMTVHVEHQFLGNTKISRNNKYNSDNRQISRTKKRPEGIFIGIPQVYQFLAAMPEVEYNADLIQISTAMMEHRSTKKVHLDANGNVQVDEEEDNGTCDAIYLVNESYTCRSEKLPKSRQFTNNQKLLMQTKEQKYIRYDAISIFGIRPVEILELVRGVFKYFEWFHISEVVLTRETINECLDEDVTKCMWIDGMGRQVKMRKQALGHIKAYLLHLDNKKMKSYSIILKYQLIEMINGSNRHLRNLFVFDDNKEDFPIVVPSKLIPEQSNQFILHIILMLGEFDTELDLRDAGTIKQTFVKAGLIHSESIQNKICMENDIDMLTKRIIDEAMQYQPLTGDGMNTFIERTEALLRSFLLDESLPMIEYPPCLANELQKLKRLEFEDNWKKLLTNELTSIYGDLNRLEDLPNIKDALDSTKDKPYRWNPFDAFKKSNIQSDESYREQKFALNVAIKSIDKYIDCVTEMGNKGVLNNGSPGAGKTFILQMAALYAKSRGLNFVFCALGAHRAKTLGGINIHQLFQIPVHNSGNIYRMAEVSFKSLHRIICFLSIKN
jgi:hypothetical protein